MFHKQARQESNLQPPVLEPTPSTAGDAAFVDFQRLSIRPSTPALLDTAGVGTIRDTGKKSFAPKLSCRALPGAYYITLDRGVALQSGADGSVARSLSAIR
jgi:hypothetical protein